MNINEVPKEALVRKLHRFEDVLVSLDAEGNQCKSAEELSGNIVKKHFALGVLYAVKVLKEELNISEVGNINWD